MIDEGLDEIDHEIHYIDEHIPEEDLEDDDEIEGLINSNKLLRDKVSHISDIVSNALEKASSLRRQIITHRDQPDDEELKSKLKEINRYQKAIMKMKYPRKKEDYKGQEMKDEIKILQGEIREMEEQQIQFIKRQNKSKNKAFKELVRGNETQNLRVVTLKDSLLEEKEIVNKMEYEKKQNEKEYEDAMKQLRVTDKQYRALVEKKIALTCTNPLNLDSEFEKDDKKIANIQKKIK